MLTGFPPRAALSTVAAPGRPHSPPSLLYSLLLAIPRCRKSRVHFPHFSPSWRAARRRRQRGETLKKSRVEVKGQGEAVSLAGRERNFTFRGRETSPLRRCSPRTAVDASDISPRCLALIPGDYFAHPRRPGFSASSRTNCYVLQNKSGSRQCEQSRSAKFIKRHVEKLTFHAELSLPLHLESVSSNVNSCFFNDPGFPDKQSVLLDIRPHRTCCQGC